MPTIEKRFTEHEMPPLFITKNMVTKVLCSLMVDKSPGLDDMHPQNTDGVRRRNADGQTIIFNRSLASKKIPGAWKKARVVANYKKKN